MLARGRSRSTIPGPQPSANLNIQLQRDHSQRLRHADVPSGLPGREVAIGPAKSTDFMLHASTYALASADVTAYPEPYDTPSIGTDCLVVTTNASPTCRKIYGVIIMGGVNSFDMGTLEYTVVQL